MVPSLFTAGSTTGGAGMPRDDGGKRDIMNRGENLAIAAAPSAVECLRNSPSWLLPSSEPAAICGPTSLFCLSRPDMRRTDFATFANFFDRPESCASFSHGFFPPPPLSRAPPPSRRVPSVGISSPEAMTSTRSCQKRCVASMCPVRSCFLKELVWSSLAVRS